MVMVIIPTHHPLVHHPSPPHPRLGGEAAAGLREAQRRGGVAGGLQLTAVEVSWR